MDDTLLLYPLAALTLVPQTITVTIPLGVARSFEAAIGFYDELRSIIKAELVKADS
jgi:hypothetical protein